MSDMVDSKALLTGLRFPNSMNNSLTTDQPAAEAPETSNFLKKEWQTSRKIRKRTKHILEHYDEIPMDVCFRVGPESVAEDIFAHKMILAMGSSDFQSMFYKNIDEVKSLIHVPDVVPEAFRMMLKYIYSEESDEMTIESVMQTLYCAKRFAMPKLAENCREFVQDNLSVDNCCVIYAEAIGINEITISLLASAIMCSRAAEVIQTPGFLRLNDLMLLNFLRMDELALDEFSVYQAVRVWMYHNRNPADETKFRLEFAGFLNYVRMPLIEPQDLANGPVQDGVISDTDLKQLFNFHFAKVKPSVAFPEMTRTARPRPFHVSLKLFAIALDPYGDNDYEDEMELEERRIPMGTVVLELRADLVPATCRAFRDQLANGEMMSLAYGGETFDRLTDEVTAMDEEGRLVVENRLLRHTPGTICYVRDPEDEQASLGELQICHEDRKVNRNGSSGLVFGRVVSGLESLGHALKFQDHIDDPAFPLHELMPRVEFYFGEWEVLADWQPAAPGEDAGAPAVSEDDEKDFMDMSFQSVENSLADSVASLI